MNFTDERLQLQLSPGWVEEYCQGLMRSTATVEKRLVALDALKTFISAAAGPALQNDKSFLKIIESVTSYLEAARAELMDEAVSRLSIALQQHDVARIAAIFTELSRSGFWDVLTQTMERMEAAQRQEVATWSLEWLEQTKRRGEEASPYPDTIDFAAAGINIAEYTSMVDLCKFVASH